MYIDSHGARVLEWLDDHHDTGCEAVQAGLTASGEYSDCVLKWKLSLLTGIWPWLLKRAHEPVVR